MVFLYQPSPFKINADNDFTSTADNSSNWNLTSLWRNTFNSNATTGELIYKSDTDTIDGIAYNDSSTANSDNSIVKRSSGKITAYSLEFGNNHNTKLAFYGGITGANIYSMGITDYSLNITTSATTTATRFCYL